MGEPLDREQCVARRDLQGERQLLSGGNLGQWGRPRHWRDVCFRATLWHGTDGGGWTHLAATYDGVRLPLYANGVEVASRAQTGNMATSANALRIGGDNPYGQFFQGIIDEVRIYKIALAPAQIQADMNTPVGNVPTTPGNLTATPVSGSEIDLS